MNIWFRMYSEFEDDPKVQMLPEEMQRRLTLLFCERCKGEQRTDAERAFKWRITEAQLAETKALFLAKEFIDQGWNLMNWNKRQFISDSSTDRVKKHRSNQALKQSETLQVVTVKQSVTAPDTDTDTDTDSKQKHKKPFERIVPPEERAGSMPLADGSFYIITKTQIADWSHAYPGVDVLQQLNAMREWLKSKPRKRKTRRGVCAFIVNWLSDKQDKGTGGIHAAANGKPNRPSLGEIDADQGKDNPSGDSDAPGSKDGRGFFEFVRQSVG